MNYRPITDIWFLARAKLQGGRRYYGAYLGGFPERARVLIGAGINDPVLHVCGGLARYYPYRGGFGPNDKTLDIDPAVEPDFTQDARDPFPPYPKGCSPNYHWRAILIDPPYSEEDAKNYTSGAINYPKPNELIKRAMAVLEVGRRVGIIHYMLPGLPKGAKFIACVGVACGFNNRLRCFSVFEKID